MRWIILIALLTTVTLTSYAQTDTPTPTPTPAPDSDADLCGNGLPCGPLPWQLPVFPVLESPTPLDLASDQNPLPGDTPTPTPDFLEQLTQAAGYEVSLTGTPFDFEVTPQDEYDEVIANSTLFFSYFKAIGTVDFGVLTPLVLAFFTIVTLTFLLKVALFLVPVLGVFAGLIRKVIELIPGF